MSDIKVSLPVIVDGIKTLKDRSLKLSLVSPELKPEEMSILFSLNQDQAACVLASKGSKIDEGELDIEMEFPEEKSPSKRLKNVLYVLWKQEESKEEFELYYRTKMERLIDFVKEKLT